MSAAQNGPASGRLHKPEDIPSVGGAEIAKRKDAVRFAIANTEIEGLTVSPEAVALLERWARGEINDDELLNENLLPNASSDTTR